MAFVDAHVRLRGPSAQISAEEDLRLLLEDMEVAGVTTSLVVAWPENFPALAREAIRHPGRLYGLLRFDSRQPEKSLQDLVLLAERFPSVLIGVKTALPYLYQSPLRQEFFPLYAFCKQRQLPIQFHFGGNPRMETACHPSLFASLARTFPEPPIVCLHGGGGGTGKCQPFWPPIPTSTLRWKACSCMRPS